MSIDKSGGSVYSWLTTVPASDNNFKNTLIFADAETIREVLRDLPKENTLTKRRILQARLRRLEKEKSHGKRN